MGPMNTIQQFHSSGVGVGAGEGAVHYLMFLA